MEKMESIVITDVALRDGLQNQKIPVSTADKIRLAGLLKDAGVPSIEASSFVSPAHVPQMADAEEVMLQLRGFPRASALTPNMRALSRAISAGVQEIAVVLSATETMNRKNVNMDLDRARRVSEEVLKEACDNGLATRAYIAVAFECPFEGLTDPEAVMELSSSMLQAGAQEIVIADTIGAACPPQVRNLLEKAVNRWGDDMLSVHFHDTRGMGLANAWAALECGIRRFDSSLGGLGGCPFAPGAAGNLATEDLVVMANQSGFHTGIDVHKLFDALEFVERRLGRPLGGHSAGWLRNQRTGNPA